MIICGVDGGQSSTRCVLATEEGRLLGSGRGGPLVHLSTQGGPEQFVTAIEQSLHDAWSGAPLTAGSIQSLVVGATGVFEETVEADLARSLLRAARLAEDISVYSDALIALHGSHGGGPGIIVISGTGTIGYGMDRKGNLARAGGWGWPLGDAGSAYAIGRAGLRAALFAFDGLAEATLLEERFRVHFQVEEMHDIKRIFFAPDFGAPGFASLAPVVSEAARARDQVALKIIAENGKALAQQALAVASKLEFENADATVSPIGGAFDHIGGLKGAFVHAVDDLATTHNKFLRVTDPQMPAVCGAVLMALKQAGVRTTSELIANIAGWRLR